MANTPVRTLRLSNETWGKLEEAAEAEAISVSDFIRKAIEAAL